ncbi:MAG: glycosyltransferase family 92 protein [Planctomycetaceae bacterium]|jgi:hypothetical protein|nr:glycosyltransferase family 92 protein [Planctomycetaceae bacterium]
MHYLSVTAIFRNENQWLEEWIRYHRHLGAEHFYLYNNDVDRTESDWILQPYVEAGLVENISYPGESMQMSAYRDAVSRAISNTNWLAFIDLDEFVLPRYCDDIRTLMQDYESFGGMGIYWNVFGSSGYIQSPPNQINHFLYRANEHFTNNRFFKCIVRPEQILINQIKHNPHYFQLKKGVLVNEQQEKLSEKEYLGNKIRIIHYAVRSYDYFFRIKRTRGLATPSSPRDQQYWNWYNRNEVFDNEISRRFGNIVQQ